MKRIILISCCGPKGPTPAAAKDLYRSPLFKASRVWGERNGDKWFILSAKLHLVSPDAMIAPYNQRLKDASRAERRAWDDQVARQLARFSADEIVVLAGRDYCGWCARFGTVRQPLAGMSGIGRRIDWLNRHEIYRSR